MHPIIFLETLVFGVILLILSIIVLLLITPTEDVFIPTIISFFVSLSLVIVGVLGLRKTLKHK